MKNLVIHRGQLYDPQQIRDIKEVKAYFKEVKDQKEARFLKEIDAIEEEERGKLKAPADADDAMIKKLEQKMKRAKKMTDALRGLKEEMTDD